MAEGFELSGWGEFKERITRDIGRIESAQDRVAQSIQDVRELIGKRIDAFRTDELERLRREQQEVREEARRLAQGVSDEARRVAEELADKLSALQAATSADISALKVKSGVWGLLGGLLVALPALLWWFMSKH